LYAAISGDAETWGFLIKKEGPEIRVLQVRGIEGLHEKKTKRKTVHT
jgi:hypothetical protein